MPPRLTAPRGWNPSAERARCEVQIDYRCPTHGSVKPLDPKAGVPVCPEMIRRTTETGVEAEECGQPLTAYLK
jgi:hypothetical protein